MLRYCFLFLAISTTGCFRYHVSEQAAAEVATTAKLKAERPDRTFCEAIFSSVHPTGDTFNEMGECVEGGFGPSSSPPRKEQTAEEFFKKGAACGSRQAQVNLRRLGLEAPEARYYAGDTGIMLFPMSGIESCGLDRYVTTTGWIVSPIGVPLYITLGAVVVGVGLSFLVVAILAGGFGGA